MGYSETDESDDRTDMYYDDTATVESTGEYLTSTEVMVTTLPNGLSVLTSDVVIQESVNESIVQLVTGAADAATTVLKEISELSTQSVVNKLQIFPPILLAIQPQCLTNCLKLRVQAAWHKTGSITHL
jgi:hypothetical protein